MMIFNVTRRIALGGGGNNGGGVVGSFVGPLFDLPAGVTYDGVTASFSFASHWYPSFSMPTGTVYTVKNSGGNFTPAQFATALATAAGAANDVNGAVIVIDDNVAMTGNFTLPNRTPGVTSWIYICSHSVRNGFGVPEGTRLTSSVGIPSIMTNAVNTPALSATSNVNCQRYRIAGLAFKIGPTVTSNSALVSVGNYTIQNDASDLPDYIIYDRCHIDGARGAISYNSRRGFSMSGTHLAVVESTIRGFIDNNTDAQGILLSSAGSNFFFRNDYIEGGDECFLAGGAEGVVAGQVPSDVVLYRCHITRPHSYNPAHPSYVAVSTKTIAKNLFELKSAERVLLLGCVLERSWIGTQSGKAINIKTVNQNGSMSWAHTTHVTMWYNIIRDCASPITIAGTEGLNQVQEDTGSIEFSHNLIYDVDSQYCPAASNASLLSLGNNSPGAGPYALRHNTVGRVGSTYLSSSNGTRGVAIGDGTAFACPGFVTIQNNLIPRTRNGIHRTSTPGVTQGISALNSWCTGGYACEGNVLWGLGAVITATQYPANNLTDATTPVDVDNLAEVLFTNPAIDDYTLQGGSPAKNYAKGNTGWADAGCDVARVLAATAGVV